MGTKATRKHHTPEPLPLHDERWIPLKAAIELRDKKTGDLGEAVLGLERDKQQRILRQKRATRERELVPAPFGQSYAIDISSWPSVTVHSRAGVDDTPQRWGMFAHQAADRIDDLFFAWLPDLEASWSSPAASAPVDQDAAHDQPPPRKPGGGRRPKFTAQQQHWLQKKYSSDLKADSRLEKNDVAAAHVKTLAKDKYDIVAERDTLLDQIIRPVRNAYSSKEK